MESAMKRRKVAQAPTDTEDDDELDLEPDELNEKRDPSFQLARKRAKAVNTLKSRFEDIFAKYEKDFTGIGDEIELSTGKVVVDNGHLSSLSDMKDWIFDDDEDDVEVEEDDEGSQLQEPEEPAPGLSSVENGPDEGHQAVTRDHWSVPEPGRTPESEARGAPPLSSPWMQQIPITNPAESAQQVSHQSSVSADPTWQAPELPPSAFIRNTVGSSGGSKGRHYGSGTPMATRTVLRSSLAAPDNSETDEADHLQDILCDALSTIISGPTEGGHLDKKSPLIKKKFPTVDSSPQDHSLVTLIQSVIENIPDTPPSIKTSRLAKSQGMPFPLGQAKRVKPFTKSKLRMSDSNQEPLKKRGRKAKTSPELTTQEDTVSGPSDQSLWNQNDLESFVDVTSLVNLKMLGQSLFIDITPLRYNGKESANTYDRPGTHKKIIHTAKKDAKNKDAATETGAGLSNKLSKSNSQEKFTRNVMDPDFSFSDEETLLPRRRPTNRCRPKPGKHASKPPPAPVVEPNTVTHSLLTKCVEAAAIAEQAVINPKMASDIHQQTTLGAEAAQRDIARDAMLVDSLSTTSQIPLSPSPEWTTECDPPTPEWIREFDQPQASQPLANPADASHQGLPKSPNRHAGSSTQIFSENDAVDYQASRTEKGDVEALVEERTSEEIAPQGESGQRRRSGRLSGKPHLARQNPKPRVKKPISNTRTRETSDANTQAQAVSPIFDTNTTTPKSHSQQEQGDLSPQDSTPAGKETYKSAAKVDTQLSRSAARSATKPAKTLQRPRTERKRTVSGQDKAMLKISLAVETGLGEALPPSIAQQQPTDEAKQPPDASSPAALESSPTPALPATQPRTPRRPKSKGVKKTPSSSFDTSLISLLSDNDDSEDEISFTHSDFTPSGNHRILVHRPSTLLPTATPRLSAASTTTKKKRAASLLYGRPSSRSSNKVSKTLRTPRSGPGTGRRQLARSVVRVSRGLGERDDSVVVQTPGGTRRRCGAEGWKCDRDFCFVCM